MPDYQTREINLDELLGERYVRHYMRILCSANPLFYVVPDPQVPDGWTTTVTRPPEVISETLVTRHGSGPEQCSSVMTVALGSEFCWDVGGYYAMLGVRPGASRTELREAYLARGGPGDRRMTFALKVLLNDRLRRQYDRLPMGEAFLPDPEISAEIKRRAARAAAARTMRSGKLVEAADVLDDWGYALMKRDRKKEDPPASGPDSSLGATLSSWELQWSYFRMEGAASPAQAADRLERWQQRLVSAFNAAGLHVHFAVGFFRGDRFKLWRNSGHVCIVFLADNEPPTPSLATEAVQGYLAHERMR